MKFIKGFEIKYAQELIKKYPFSFPMVEFNELMIRVKDFYPRDKGGEIVLKVSSSLKTIKNVLYGIPFIVYYIYGIALFLCC